MDYETVTNLVEAAHELLTSQSDLARLEEPMDDLVEHGEAYWQELTIRMTTVRLRWWDVQNASALSREERQSKLVEAVEDLSELLGVSV